MHMIPLSTANAKLNRQVDERYRKPSWLSYVVEQSGQSGPPAQMGRQYSYARPGTQLRGTRSIFRYLPLVEQYG